MNDLSGLDLENTKDRFVRGELTASESRALAQKSLDDSELFEELTFSALAKAVLAARSTQDQLRRLDSKKSEIPLARKGRLPLMILAAAAGLVLGSLYFVRFIQRRDAGPSLPQDRTLQVSTALPLRPALGLLAKPEQPILLSSDLQAVTTPQAGTPIFRAPKSNSRSPQATGSILSIEDGEAAIDLGALDGLAIGSELPIFRDDQTQQSIGRLIVTTVFRERARGRIQPEEEVHVHDRVQVTGQVHLQALLLEVEALAGRGESEAARALADKAVTWSESNNNSPAEQGQILEQLALLEYQAGLLESAETHLRTAIDRFKQSPKTQGEKQAAALNNLAILLLLRGDNDGAEILLNQALALSSPASRLSGRCLNNLGVLAEMTGDRPKAERLYAKAKSVFGTSADSPETEQRQVEKNLARLSNSR